MNKSQLIDVIAENASISKSAAGKALDSCIDGITDALSKGESVQLIGFGTFKVSERSARKGRNPRTGEEIEIPASKVPSWKASKGLIK